MNELETKRRGAFPTPRHKLQAAMPFRPGSAPPEFGVVPPVLSFWGNQTYGVCVTTEEAYAKAVWSLQCGLPELFIDEATVIAWARKHNFLDGADLVEVMDAMQRAGFPVGANTFGDGPPHGVDYSNETILQAAIFAGPVKIGIDADALPSNAGDMNGWYATAGGRFTREDHCVALSGYGSAAFLFNLMALPVPSGLPPTMKGYLLFTWKSIGFVTHAWLMGTCGEAWVRVPTTPGQEPIPPTPPTPPTPPIPPTPPVPPVPPVPPTPTQNVLSLLTGLPPGTYAIGPAAGVDPVKLLAILQELAALLGVPLTPAMRVALAPVSRAAVIPWAAVMQIVFMVLALLTRSTPPTPADLQALIMAIMALLAGG